MSNVQIHKIHSFSGHLDSVYTLEASDQPSSFFSGAGDGMVVLWDLENLNDGELIARLPNSVYSLLHLRKEKLVVAGQNFSGIHLIDYTNKKELTSLQLTSSAIFDIKQFGGDLIVASGEGMITIVDLKKWVVKKKIAASEKSARAIAINAEAGEMAVGYSDHFVRIFSLNNYELIHQLQAHQNSVFTVCYARDEKVLLTGSRDAKLKAWKVDDHYQLMEEVTAHLFAINHIAFSPGGKYFATASMDKSIKVWKAQDLTLLKVIDKGRHAGHGTSVNKLLWTSYNNQLLSASDDRTISAWDLLFL